MNAKEHILKESLLLFLQKSYKEVTMQELVKKTGLSKGAFYHYFVSKEDLFREILHSFFSAIMSFDFGLLNNQSLFQFYNDYSNKINSMRLKLFESDENHGFLNLNFFSLLFDAFKLFPEFKENMEAYHQRELKAWKNAIKNAREKGEIKTPLDDEQIAMIFIFSSDGLTMNLTMSGNMADLSANIKSIWDNFYLAIKK